MRNIVDAAEFAQILGAMVSNNGTCRRQKGGPTRRRAKRFPMQINTPDCGGPSALKMSRRKRPMSANGFLVGKR